MATLGNLFSASAGNGYQASGTNIVAPTTQNEADNLYTQSQGALAQQGAFANALGAQNGIQNQSNVYNQLQGVANGTGANPATALLNQQTGNNIAAQSALMAGQRGTGANAGLLARQAAQQGAATQQNAVGQAATTQANQSLNALSAAGNIAGQQVTNQGNAVNAFSTATQGEQSNLLNGIAGQNNANVAMQGNENSNNATIANTNAQAQNKLTSGLINQAGGALAMMASGGVVKMADASQAKTLGPQSKVGQHLFADGGGVTPDSTPTVAGAATTSDSYLDDKGSGGGSSPGPGALMALMAKGGKVPAMLSPGEKYLDPREAKAVATKQESAAKVGKVVPGKASVKGDSLKNDTVPAKLDPGGVVLPRHVMNSKDPAAAAHKFVTAVLAKSNMKKASK